MAEWRKKYDARRAAFDAGEHIDIGGPFDGETFKDATLEAFLARLLSLREAGYNFPDDVLDTVREEIADDAAPSREDIDHGRE